MENQTLYLNRLESNLSDADLYEISQIMSKIGVEPVKNGYISNESLIDNPDYFDYFQYSLGIDESDQQILRTQFHEALKEEAESQKRMNDDFESSIHD